MTSCVVILSAILLLPSSQIQSQEQIEGKSRPKAVDIVFKPPALAELGGTVFIKGGWFEMGDTFGDGDSDERPVHRGWWMTSG